MYGSNLIILVTALLKKNTLLEGGDKGILRDCSTALTKMKKSLP
jgi:hypothetical protein